MRVYRITVGTDNPHFTTRKSEKLVHILLAHGQEHFTMREVIGYYYGRKVTTFEVDISIDDADRAQTLAEAIGLAFHQKSVMLTYVGDAQFINLTEVFD